jgi:hypothetical protein
MTDLGWPSANDPPRPLPPGHDLGWPCAVRESVHPLPDGYTVAENGAWQPPPPVCCYASEGGCSTGTAPLIAFVRRFDGELHPSRRCTTHARRDDEPGWPLALVIETTDLQAALGYTMGYRTEPPGRILWRRPPNRPEQTEGFP